VAGITLVDDYAHHPTEVRATLDAASSAASGKVWAIFQPHLYSRTERFYTDFAEALGLADEVVVTDVYGAREEPVPGITGELIVDSARDRGTVAHYVPHRADLVSFLVPLVESGDMVISMGAGDITLLHGELAAQLAESS
jgi:UDP-N-acetylmuramate--alanine ligase